EYPCIVRSPRETRSAAHPTRGLGRDRWGAAILSDGRARRADPGRARLRRGCSRARRGALFRRILPGFGPRGARGREGGLLCRDALLGRGGRALASRGRNARGL
ncbi:MAG: hypothetical protein AVDCRST_MAG25-3256, partial [uncultured Rubrobacteraceae bacterium]